MMTPEEVAQLNADQQRLAAARETDVVQDVHARFGAQAKMDPKTGTGPIMTWLGNLPKNIGVGVIDAAVNTADMVGKLNNTIADKAGIPETPEDNVVDEAYLAARQHVLNFRDEMATNSNTSDEITQALAQYTIPWLGFMKVMGIAGKAPLAAKAAGVVTADALTAFSVYKPHDTRFADVLALAKHTEGKLGAAMNTIAPDGSLLNAYIDYMTDRSTEGEWEGRVKNVTDNFVLSVAGAGVIAAGGATLKAAFKTAKYAAHNVGAGPVGLSAQRGSLGAATPRVNNASGESAASLEAVNRVAEEKALGRMRMVIDATGEVRPVVGTPGVDAKAGSGQVIVQRGIGEKEWTVLDHGSDVPRAHLTGILNASKSKLDSAVEAGAK